jgi:hypothetical protein
VLQVDIRGKKNKKKNYSIYKQQKRPCADVTPKMMMHWNSEGRTKIRVATLTSEPR